MGTSGSTTEVRGCTIAHADESASIPDRAGLEDAVTQAG
jgi:hypothetical protein